MDQDPRELEQRIERTRAGLGDNIDALADKVSPSRMVARRMDSAKNTLSGVKDTVMGTAQSATDAIGDGATSSSTALRRQTQGNPLAVGVMAFGLGWLVSSLLPASDTETKLRRFDGSGPAGQSWPCRRPVEGCRRSRWPTTCANQPPRPSKTCGAPRRTRSTLFAPRAPTPRTGCSRQASTSASQRIAKQVLRRRQGPGHAAATRDSPGSCRVGAVRRAPESRGSRSSAAPGRALMPSKALGPEVASAHPRSLGYAAR